MVRIRKQLTSSRGRSYSGTSTRTSITIHETANRNRGANAAAHANLQSRGNSRAASWHYQVDDKEAVQSFSHGVRCWHAGRLARNSIAIEICVNSDGDYGKALQNAAELVAHIRDQEPNVKRVVQHHLWTWKNCPTLLRSGAQGGWNAFLRKAAAAGRGEAPSRGNGRKSKRNVSLDGKWGRNTTKWLQRRLKEAGLYSGAIDGRIDSQNRRWRSRNKGLTTGWQWRKRGYTGSRTIRALQGVVGAKQDGLVGPQTIKALQRWLTSDAKYTGSIDGEIWKPSSTVKALQKVLNSKRGFKR